MSGDDTEVPAARGLAAGLAAHRQLECTIRAEYGRVLSLLLRELRDFDLAEDALGDAIVEAAERWPVGGVPATSAAWLLTVARRRAIDRLRRRGTARRRAPLLVVPDADDPLATVHRRTGDLIVKLDEARVAELINAGVGHPFAPAGKMFREWVAIRNPDPPRSPLRAALERPFTRDVRA